MASNALPDKIDLLLTLCEDMEDGLATYESIIGIRQNTNPFMAGARNAANNAQNAFLAQRGAKPPLVTAQTVADSNGKAFISTSQGNLANYLGSGYSQAWEAAGYQNGSLAMPATVEERQAMLGLQAAYYTAHPAQESTPLITATRASTLATLLSDARAAVNAASTAIGNAKAARDAAVSALRKRMRGLIDELDSLLSADDPRWYAFGLNRPADPETPGIPDGLVLTLGSAGVLYIDWADARRAESYRVWMQIVGVDTEFSAVATVTESDATLTGLPSGATVRIQVTAQNDAGESLPSATLSAVVA